jgi:flagellar motor switch protein FliN/FliY
VVTTDLQTILKLKVPVLVLIGQRRLPLEDVLALGPGAILDLNKSSDEELELLAHNKSIGSGLAVKVGENFGIRISRIGSPRERAEALSG